MKSWVKPVTEVQKFEANEYVAACWGVGCDVNWSNDYEKRQGDYWNDLHPVKRTEKKYKFFPASSQTLLAAFYAARHNLCFSIGVSTPKLRCTRLVL